MMTRIKSGLLSRDWNEMPLPNFRKKNGPRMKFAAKKIGFLYCSIQAAGIVSLTTNPAKIAAIIPRLSNLEEVR